MHRVKTTVTPEQARTWLLGNTHNRVIRRIHVGQYARDMAAGRFNYNPLICIAITSDGVIVDGQHRLLACVKSGRAFDSDVVFDVPIELQKTVDRGAVRQAKDEIQICGIKNSTRLAALARLLLVYFATKDVTETANSAPSRVEVEEYVLTGGDHLQSSLLSPGDLKGMCPARIFDFCNFLFSDIDADTCRRFMRELCTGTGLSDSNPAYQLRKRLIQNGTAKAKLPPRIITALFFKAWQAYREGAEVYNLRWRTDGRAPEPFPSI